MDAFGARHMQREKKPQTDAANGCDALMCDVSAVCATDEVIHLVADDATHSN